MQMETAAMQGLRTSLEDRLATEQEQPRHASGEPAIITSKKGLS